MGCVCKDSAPQDGVWIAAKPQGHPLQSPRRGDHRFSSVWATYLGFSVTCHPPYVQVQRCTSNVLRCKRLKALRCFIGFQRCLRLDIDFFGSGFNFKQGRASRFLRIAQMRY
jgi:hypothetical protein